MIPRENLLFKLLKSMTNLTFHKLLNDMLTNRYFIVHIEASKSSKKQLNNGLLKSSVLALTISKLLNTTSQKIAYADDITITI